MNINENMLNETKLKQEEIHEELHNKELEQKDLNIKCSVKENKMKMTVGKKMKNIREKMKKNPKKTKKIITAISTTMLSMLLLVSVTYAWFTLTNKPKIEGFMLKVGTTGTLKISKDKSKYDNSISFEDIQNLCLKPLSTIDCKTFYKPSTRTPEGTVNAVAAVPDSELEKMINLPVSKNGYLIKKTFYLKAETESEISDVGIKLIAGSGSGNTITGTYINNKNGSGASAIRVGFIYSTNAPKILEPSHEVGVTGATTQHSAPNWTVTNPTTIKMNKDHKFVTDSTTSEKSDVLFRIPKNDDALVTMYIWLEGADKDCVNEIQGSDIEYSFQFTSDDIE